MSIEVPISQLNDALADRPFAYLVTAADDGRPHVIALRPRPVDVAGRPTLRFETGSRRAATNVGVRPDVTLVFPPTDPDGMTLIVDGTAVGTRHGVDVTPTGAVLHRAAPMLPDEPDA